MERKELAVTVRLDSRESSLVCDLTYNMYPLTVSTLGLKSTGLAPGGAYTFHQGGDVGLVSDAPKHIITMLKVRCD